MKKPCILHDNCRSVENTNHRYPSTWSLFLSIRSIAWLHGTHLRGFARQLCPCSHWINSKTGPFERIVISARFIAQDYSPNCLMIVSFHGWLIILHSAVSGDVRFFVTIFHCCDARQKVWSTSNILLSLPDPAFSEKCVYSLTVSKLPQRSFFSCVSCQIQA